MTRLTATRIDESFFLRSASAGGSSIATTSLHARTTARCFADERDFGERFGERRLEADQDDVRVGVLLEELQRRRDGDGRAVIAAHRVDGNGDRHANVRVGRALARRNVASG